MDPDLLIIWCGIIAVVVVVNLFIYLNRRSRYELLEKLSEKGPLSPELLANIASNGQARRYEEKHTVGGAIFLMCIGVALAVFFWAFFVKFGNPIYDHDGWFVAIGIFPFMVGLARLLGSLFDKRPEK
jgi:hypothetical protein